MSAAFDNLQRQQTFLNRFLWSTELSYGIVLTTDDKRLKSSEIKLDEALHDVEAQAWYPNAKDAVHYATTVGKFKQHLQFNTGYMYRAVAVLWYSSFESYLNSRVLPLLTPLEQRAQKERGGWGEFVEKLRQDRFASGRLKKAFALDLLIDGDFFRDVRNTLVHAKAKLPHMVVRHPGDMPPHASKRGAEFFVGRLAPKVRKYWKPHWSEEATVRHVGKVLNRAIGGALYNQDKAKTKEHKDIPLAYFYLLFAFTSYRRLAEDIECCIA
jgi:hypothetical protein